MVGNKSVPKAVLKNAYKLAVVQTMTHVFGTPASRAEAITGDWWSRPAATALLEQVTPDSRLPMLLLAQVAAGIEATIGRSAWRTPSDRLARYLGFLESVGYGVSEVERLVFPEEVAATTA